MALWAGGAAAVLASLTFGPGLALLETNTGALLQTRVELSRYRWPEWPVQDAVRRANVVDLAAAIALYGRALAASPTSVPANRRLGQIELSLGNYDSARRHLEVAFQGEPDYPATRQMFGESLALTGDVEGAAELWRALPLAQDQLAIRLAWYASTGDPLGAERFREAVALTRANTEATHLPQQRRVARRCVPTVHAANRGDRRDDL